MSRTNLRVSMAVGLLSLVGISQAADAIDVSVALAAIAAAAIAITAVGGAQLGMHFGGRVYKWIKSAI